MYNTLVVDDEFWMCEGLKVVIEQCCPDFTVTDMAYDGQEAVGYMEKNEYDLVVTDIRMGEMDGLQLIEEMHERGWDIPVVVISGYDEFEYARKALRFGVIDYLLKPLDRQEIKDVLQNLKETRLTDKDGDSKEDLLESGMHIVDYLKKMVEHHYMDDLGIAPLANKTGYNPSYLSRVFKLDTGMGFIQYLTKKRMSVACQYLLETDLTVADIAKKSGYMDDKYFSRIFKKEFGIPPGEYREKKRKGNKYTHEK